MPPPHALPQADAALERPREVRGVHMAETLRDPPDEPGIGHLVRMPSFPEHVWKHALTGLAGVPGDDLGDTYVVSFFVEDEDDDPRRPVVTIGTNTEARVRFAMHPPDDFTPPHTWWRPSDELEARWNYAFWLQNRLALIGDSRADPGGAALREDWFRAQGLWFADDDDSDEADAIGSTMTEQFVRLCVDTVKRLHDSGAIVTRFGRPIPVIVHELEYDDAIVNQNVEANPPDLVAGLASWLASM